MPNINKHEAQNNKSNYRPVIFIIISSSAVLQTLLYFSFSFFLLPGAHNKKKIKYSIMSLPPAPQNGISLVFLNPSSLDCRIEVNNYQGDFGAPCRWRWCSGCCLFLRAEIRMRCLGLCWPCPALKTVVWP